MVPEPLVLQEVMLAGDVYDMLAASEHNGFPVVGESSIAAAALAGGSERESASAGPVFKGLIRRQHLTTMLKHRDLCR